MPLFCTSMVKIAQIVISRDSSLPNFEKITHSFEFILLTTIWKLWVIFSKFGKDESLLIKLREDYPQLRVYSFDYNLDLSAIQTLISINKVDKRINSKLWVIF